MKTLDSWKFLLDATPRTMIFPRMELMSGHDHEQPVLVGRGEVEIRTANSFEYRLSGIPQDALFAFEKLTASQKNPYDTFQQFRLVGTDERGIEWACGWTRPRIGEWTDHNWTLTGAIQGLSTDVRGPNVSPVSSVELAFLAPMHEPVGGTLIGVVQGTLPASREYELEILGTRVDFSYDVPNGVLWACAPTSKGLSHPFAENWIGEPFRVIFGQLIYPRLIARNFGDGRSAVSLRRSPSYLRGAEFAALWRADCVEHSKARFWELYSKLLIIIAEAQPSQPRDLESHTVTRLYEEIALAARGSRWVWTLTLASAIEGLTNIISPPRKPRDDADHDAIAALAAHIEKWVGDSDLRARAISEVRRAGLTSAMHALRALRKQGVLTDAQVSAWSEIRNSVMHGNLVTPWSTEDEDKRILDLANLFHRLTCAILGND